MAASFAPRSKFQIRDRGDRMPSSRQQKCRIVSRPHLPSLFLLFSPPARCRRRQTSVTPITTTTTAPAGIRRVVLTPANVSAATFGRLQTVPLDDQVDAQRWWCREYRLRRGIIRHARCGLCGDPKFDSDASRLNRDAYTEYFGRHIDHIVRA